MVIDTVSAFVEAIGRSRLLEPHQQREVVNDLQARFPDPRALGRELIQRNWLTPYQVNQLVQGRGSALVIDQYRILERIGEGGMGQVFKAQHLRLGRTVALKVIKPEHLANATAVRRFHREAQAAAKLEHANIVRVFDAGESDGTHFLAMEYVEGTDLSKLLQRSGRLPVAEACEYVRQAALGLQHAHEQGLVHRDVKPHNLLVATGGRKLPEGPSHGGNAAPAPDTLKVLDMGLARLHFLHDEGSSVTAMTQAGVVIGTLDYMAPEQAKNSHSADHRADLYSLGCTLYHLLAGQPPFAGSTGMEKLLCHQLDAPPPVTQCCPEAPAGLVAVLQRLLAKRPEDRFQTAAEVASALAPFSTPGAMPPSSRTCTSPPHEPQPTVVVQPQPASEVTTWDLTQIATPSEAAAVVRPRQPPRPASTRRWLVPAGVAGGLALLLVAIWIGVAASGARHLPDASASSTAPKAGERGDRGLAGIVAPPRWDGEGAETKPLETYLPRNTVLVAGCNVRAALAAPLWQDPALRKALTAIERSSFKKDLASLGMEPLKDVDTLLTIWTLKDANPSLLLLQGRFDPERFEGGPDGWRQTGAEGQGGVHYRLYESAAREHRSAGLLAVVSRTTLVFSEEREPLLGILDQASGWAKPEMLSPVLPGLLAKVDRTQAAWIAGLLTPLANSREEGLRGPEFMPKPARERLRTVPLRTTMQGTLRLAEDARSEVVFASLEQEDTLLVRGLVEALCKRPPWSRFVREPDVTRAGTTVRVRTRHTPAELAKALLLE